jgi:hypothetical protein
VKPTGKLPQPHSPWQIRMTAFFPEHYNVAMVVPSCS